MKPTPTANGKYRIGSFELDLSVGEIHNNGLRVRLQEQRLEVLTRLAECPGDVVTREELRLKLWPADTFVDFNHGLNRASEFFTPSDSLPRKVQRRMSTIL